MEPGIGYHGTFPRWIGEPRPPAENPQMWRDYDPKLAAVHRHHPGPDLDEYSERRLSPEQIVRIDRAIRLAVEGEPAERCPASYTNIAMKAALLTWAGERYGKAVGLNTAKASAHRPTVSSP